MGVLLLPGLLCLLLLLLMLLLLPGLLRSLLLLLLLLPGLLFLLYTKLLLYRACALALPPWRLRCIRLRVHAVRRRFSRRQTKACAILLPSQVQPGASSTPGAVRG